MVERQRRSPIVPEHTSPRSIFQRGEFVQLQIGDHSGSDRLWFTNVETNQSAYILRQDLPWIAKFIRGTKDSQIEVEFPRVADGRTLRYRLAREYVGHLPNGRAQVLRSVLSCVPTTPTLFAPGDEVRFRDAGGLMREGRFPCRARAGEVFSKWTTGLANSISFDSGQLKSTLPHSIPLGRPCKFLREYLNAAAHLSSHPEFREVSFERRLNILMQFQNIVLPYTQASDTLEVTGVQTLSEVLCAGSGMCRHNTPLIAAVMSEAGLDVRVVHRIAEPGEFAELGGTHYAHVWIEVTDAEGGTFIVDPSNAKVRSVDEARAEAGKNPHSVEGRWWAHDARETLKIESFSN